LPVSLAGGEKEKKEKSILSYVPLDFAVIVNQMISFEHRMKQLPPSPVQSYFRKFAKSFRIKSKSCRSTPKSGLQTHVSIHPECVFVVARQSMLGRLDHSLCKGVLVYDE
jgi:hypothetical protein